jgi:hypothetical protein
MSATVDLTLVLHRLAEAQLDIRAIKRDLAMLRAQQAEFPTLAQFQAGLSAFDAQFVELGNIIAQKVTAAIGEHLDAIAARLDAMERRP